MVYFLLSVAFGCAISLTLISLVFSNRDLYRQNQQLLKTQQNEISEYLELATSEQLLSELRRRPKISFMLISPTRSSMGVELQVFNIPPIVAAQMCVMATKMTFDDLKSKGVKFSDLPWGSFPQWSAHLLQDEDENEQSC